MNFYCFFRCTTLEYAEKFLTSGNLRFGTANEWIKEALINEEGRGDLLEGSYIATNDNLVAKIHSTNKNIKVHEKNNLFFIQRTKVLKLRAYCLYGLSELNFTKSCRATNKMKVPAGEISKDYFCTFFPNINQQEYDNLEKNKKPVVLLIKNTKLFMERLIACLNSIGIKSDEILSGPITYIDKCIPHFLNVPAPLELFYKHLKFKNQSEFRIVINTKNKKAIKTLEKKDGILNIGNLRDIAEIYDYYFEDLKMLINNGIIEYSLPRGISYTLTNPIEMMCLVHQALRDEMPGDKTWADNEATIKDLLCQLEKKEIYFNWDKLYFYNKNGENIFDASDVIDVHCQHAQYFISEKEFNKAIESYKIALRLKPNSMNLLKKLVELYLKIKDYDSAIKLTSYLVKINPENIDLLELHRSVINLK